MNTLVNRMRPAAWWLMALMVFQSAGWMLAWQGLYVNAKMNAIRHLQSENGALPRWELHKTLFSQIRLDDKELRMNGHLYDYKIVSENTDFVTLALYKDKHEQALYSVLGNLAGSTHNPGGMAAWLAKCIAAVFLVPLSEMPAIPCALQDVATHIPRALHQQFSPATHPEPPDAPGACC